jgi:hypothetical protein
MAMLQLAKFREDLVAYQGIDTGQSLAAGYSI